VPYVPYPRPSQRSDAEDDVPAPQRHVGSSGVPLERHLVDRQPSPVNPGLRDDLSYAKCPELQVSGQRKRKVTDEPHTMPVTKMSKISSEQTQVMGHSDDIASGAVLSAITALKSPLFKLPVEIIYRIGTYTDTETVHSLTAICHYLANCFIPLYFKRQDFRAPRIDCAYPTIVASTIQHFTALQLWRRSSLFRPLKYAIFTMRSEDADRRAESLRIFFESLHGTIFTRHLTIYIHSPTLPAISTVLQNIVGCRSLAIEESNCDSSIAIEGIPTFEPHQHIACHVAAQTQIDRFMTSSPLVFMPCLLPWTFMLLTSAKLRDLDLQNTPLLPDQWANILSQITIPTLRKVAISIDVPPHSVIDFLLRHTHLNSLVFGRKSDPGCSDYSNLGELSLPFLRELRGPVNVVKSFLDVLQPSLTITDLAIELYPVGSTTTELVINVQDVLNHLSCAILPRLTLAFCNPEDTLMLEHLDFGFTGSPVEDLIITHGREPFTFTEVALVNI
jgi:hypothetical protein